MILAHNFQTLSNRMSRFFAFILTILAASVMPAEVLSLPTLPDPEPTWKNVRVDGKKVAVFCFYKDSRDLMWLGTNNGLYFYDGVTPRPVCEDILKATQIYSLVEKDGKLFLGTNNGLKSFDYIAGKISHDLTSSPREIRTLLSVDDDLWIGGLDGLCRYNTLTGTSTDLSATLPNRSVYSMLRDSRGIIYVGTYKGLARWDARKSQFHPLRIRSGGAEQPLLFANCLLESDDRESIYVGGEGALYRYSPASDNWKRVNAVDNINIKSLTNGKDGHILVGSDNGVFDLSGDSIRHYRHDSGKEFSIADNEIWSIFSDSDNNIWTGHERGFSIASNSSAMRDIRISDLTGSGEGNVVYSIFRDRNHDLWFAGSNGAIRISGDRKPFWYRHTDRQNSLSHNRVRAIHEDSDNNIWLATDGGLNRFNRNSDSFDTFHVVDTLGEHNSNWIYSLVEDGDSFWVGGFLSGLMHVGKKAFSTKGGLIAADHTINSESDTTKGYRLRNDFINNVIKDPEGNLWILLFRDSVVTRYSPLTHHKIDFNIRELAGEYPSNISIDRKGKIWCAFKGGVIILSHDMRNKLIRFPDTNSDESILSMGKVGDGMWISTQSNVWAVNPDSSEADLLPLPQNSYTAVYEDTVAGKVYLGGTDQILEVDVDAVVAKPDYKTIRMVLRAGGGSNPLSFQEIQGKSPGLRLPYGGNITLMVSTLNYAPEALHRYMYKLARSESDTVGGWVVMPEGVNTITFSDLNMGNYLILVKALGSTEGHVAIPLSVDPHPALSWWALTIYFFIAVALIFWIIWYVRRKNLRTFREQERQTALENVERKLTFLSSISHDLKTPLSMIIGPVSLMKEQAREPETKKNLESIYNNAVKLNNMIHRTLELQHLDDNNENLLITSTFDVVEFCRSVFDVFRENNPQKKFLFISEAPQLLIEADAVKFESVITNLLSNACKYSDEGATISCGIRRENDKVEIVVSDDGMGISETDQPLVFQRMFRAPATSDLREGTGLGLYLIRRYLALMGGSVDLYSKEGVGTSFVVRIPVTDKTLPGSAIVNEDEESDLPKILIVEDNMEISGFLVNVLSGNYTSLVADNGRAGLSIASSFIPDLIIADEMMPVMTGLEMVRRMKQNPRLSSIPIIMLTAKSDINTENESIKSGIDIFMAKPFEPSALIARIGQLLKSRTEIREKARIQAITEAESHPIEAESVNEKLLAKIARTIEENISDPDLNVNLLCEKCDIPNKQLYRLIKKYMDLTPLDYIRRVRLQKAAVLLGQRRFTVAEISYMVGFRTPSYFAKCFQNRFGVTPGQYKPEDDTIGHD